MAPRDRCDGCGSAQTIKEIRAQHPKAVACCPERKMVSYAVFVRQRLQSGWTMEELLASVRRRSKIKTRAGLPRARECQATQPQS